MGRFFLLTDPLEEQKWKMTGESKKIGKYTCYKATYEKEVEEATFSFGNFNFWYDMRTFPYIQTHSRKSIISHFGYKTCLCTTF